MKLINALVLSGLAGITTFGVQQYFLPAQLHAAAFVVPTGSDWRQQMIDRELGGAATDRALEHITDRLFLNPAQARSARPILEREHERILALLLTGPATLTRGQFVSDRQAIRNDAHRRIGALLTPEQRAAASEADRPSAS